MKRTSWPGNWKCACQRCGFWFPSSEIKKEWTGLLVCEKCWEPRHEQTLIQTRAETAVPDFVSKDSSPDTFVASCDAYSILPRADFGTADCAIVGLALEPDPYQYRWSSIAAYAIAGIAITGME